MRLSFVTSMYATGAFAEEFVVRTLKAGRALADEVEIVLVDDGSPDDTLDKATAVAREHPEVQVLELSRNFGHHKAMMTGLSHATGDLVYLTDSDLEEPPELVTEFRAQMIETGADVVYGVQQQRKGAWFERVTGALFYRLINALSYDPIPRNLVTARLMTRDYVDALVQHRDREVFLAGLWATTGFRQVPRTITKGHRGASTYNLRRKLAVAVNSVTSFSDKPLVGIFYLGLIIFAISASVALYLVGKRIVLGTLLPGWLSLIVSVWVLGGLTLASVGVIGIYLAKVFGEVKDRPYTVVRAVHTGSTEAVDGGEPSDG